MCGITGYLGGKDAYPVLVDGLKQLEYRGYDSAGIALINGSGDIMTYKSRGKVSMLEEKIKGRDVSGCTGIAHTRWATHGEPNDVNAHPHLSMSGNIALVHNGIIENYRVLRDALMENGGPIALVDQEMPIVAIAVPDSTYDKTASNIEEIKTRGGKIVAVVAADDDHVRKTADYCIEVPTTEECLMPIVVSIPLQLLAYHIAVYKGRDVDQPRNLAKSVTVE